MNGGAAALEEIEGLGGFGRFVGLRDFAEFAARVHTNLSEYSTGRLSLRVGECPRICLVNGPACLKSGHEKDSGGLECNQGRQITTQFERDARRGAQRNRVGLRRDNLTDPMMEPAVSNTTLGWPKYCIFCIQPSQQGAYQRP